MKDVIHLLKNSLNEYTETLKYAEAAYAQEPELLERYRKHYLPLIEQYKNAINSLENEKH